MVNLVSYIIQVSINNKKKSAKIINIFLAIILAYVLGVQKNRLFWVSTTYVLVEK